MAQIIASEIVKPSSPTPSTARKYKLSSIDQLIPPIYTPYIFFYETDGPKFHDQISQCLKKSLSETLAIFYPLAGTIERNSFVDCNDGGVEMVEARLPARLSQFIQNPKMEELKQLLNAYHMQHANNAIISLKTTYFDCGGFAVGLCFSHKVGDGVSAVAFMNAWAVTCCGEASRIIHPALDQLALRFPPRETPDEEFNFSVGEETVTERFVFEEEMLEKLRKEASTGEVKNPSRVEALSAFIWRSLIDAAKKGNKTTSTSRFIAGHALNLRPRAVLPFPNRTFGNCVTAAYAKISPEEDDGGITVLVSKLRAAIRGVIFHKDELIIDEAGREIYEAGNCIFSSWWRFPVYDVDFGWGKPVWVSTAPMPAGNAIVFMATPSREGIEAWINLSHHNRHTFESLRANYNHLFN